LIDQMGAMAGLPPDPPVTISLNDMVRRLVAPVSISSLFSIVSAVPLKAKN